MRIINARRYNVEARKRSKEEKEKERKREKERERGLVVVHPLPWKSETVKRSPSVVCDCSGRDLSNWTNTVPITTPITMVMKSRIMVTDTLFRSKINARWKRRAISRCQGSEYSWMRMRADERGGEVGNWLDFQIEVCSNTSAKAAGPSSGALPVISDEFPSSSSFSCLLSLPMSPTSSSSSSSSSSLSRKTAIAWTDDDAWEEWLLLLLLRAARRPTKYCSPPARVTSCRN